MIFIIQVVQIIVFIFTVIFTAFQSIYPPAFFRYLNSGAYSELCGLNKGRGSKFCVGFQVRQKPEEGQKTYQPKRYECSNKDENSEW